MKKSKICVAVLTVVLVAGLNMITICSHMMKSNDVVMLAEVEVDTDCRYKG